MFAAPTLPFIPTVSHGGVSSAPLWVGLVLLALTLGMLLGTWLASHFVVPPGNQGGWGRPPREQPDPPGPKGVNVETSWIDDVERFLAEQSLLNADHPTRPQ